MATTFDDKVSIVIPIYNASEFLDQCLDSIEVQTYKNLEIICVNDGSTDNSLEIINKHAAADERYVVVDKENAGYGAGCNKGIEVATGDWFAVVEPDDYIDSGMYGDMLEHAYKVASKAASDGYVVVGGDAPEPVKVASLGVDIIKTPWNSLCEWDDPKTLYVMPSPLEGHIKTTDKVFTLEAEPKLIAVHPSIWTALYRLDFLREKNIKFPEYPGAGWADNPFLVETMCQAAGIVYLDKPYYNYRSDLPNTTMDHSGEAIARPMDRWLEMMDIIERLGVTDLGILQAHYLRGFNYVFGANHDDGSTNPIVAEKTREVYERMDPDIVFSIDILAEHRRKNFCEVRGIPEPKVSKAARIKYLMGQSVSALKTGGPRMFIERLQHTLFVEKKELTGERIIVKPRGKK